MPDNRSQDVIDQYKQDKINASALAGMRRILFTSESEHKKGRRFAIVGLLVLASALLAIGLYLYTRISHGTLS
ncbi:MAG: hypothetical protein AAF434_17430 [Pseudomonadota bacterium]